MFNVVIAHTEDIDSDDAAAELVEQARGELGEEVPKAGLLFAAVDHDYEMLLACINEAFPGIELIGCTTDGELSTRLGFAEDSITLTLFVSDEVEIVAGLGRDVSTDPAGSLAAGTAEATVRLDKDPVLAIFTPTGLTASGSVMVEHLQKALPGIPVVGGTAGDQWKFESTHQFFRGEVLLDGAPFLLFSQPLKFSTQVRSGWEPIGKEGVVTRSQGNVVHEIDDMTAVQFYRQYLGDGAMDHLGESPLAVHDGERGNFYLRAALFCSDADGTVTFAGDIAEGTTVQLTSASRDEIIAATREAVDACVAAYPGDRPTAALIFSCAGRKQVLGTRTQEEYQLLQEHFPDLRLAGFYTYGEIAPMAAGQPTRFHNETFVSLLLGTD